MTSGSQEVEKLPDRSTGTRLVDFWISGFYFDVARFVVYYSQWIVKKNLFEYLNYDKNFPDIGQNGIKKQFTPKCFFGYPCFVIKKRDWINVAIRRRISNLKKTHIGTHRSVPWQPCMARIHTSEDGLAIQGWTIHQMYFPYIGGWFIHRRMVHTSELQCSNMHSDVWLHLYAPLKRKKNYLLNW